MTLCRDGEYITITVNGQSETMLIGDWSKIISRPSKIERFTFARGTPDHFSTDEHVEPPCA
ncbi:MAG: hypothetical protein AB7S74_18825 [Hyphomicrobium sp.]